MIFLILLSFEDVLFSVLYSSNLYWITLGLGHTWISAE
ncbi:hypothetical protein L291_0901 [Acinetobacter guillouiae MSP4-18]|nr:hypothetical protein L291_0901 [Acinetobacter guillouiae MSP4-18]